MSAPRPETLSVGDALPELPIDITAKLIVGGAIASRDYQDVHPFQRAGGLAACRTQDDSTGTAGKRPLFPSFFFRCVTPLCASKWRKNGLAFPIVSLRIPESDRLIAS